MSSVPITVELPQYTQTFVVNVPPTSTVGDIKQEISRACPGNPRVDGQRLISRGRILDDAERVESLWIIDEEVRVVHLAVNPWSWSTDPPEVPGVPPPAQASSAAAPIVSESLRQLPQQTVHRQQDAVDDAPGHDYHYHSSVSFPPYPRHDALQYIHHIHHKALRALSPTAPPMIRQLVDATVSKSYTIRLLQASGYSWPAIFDEEYPSPTEGGVTYEYIMIGGIPYLQSLTPHATPTPRQQHALNVLAYTFPLLSVTSNELVHNLTMRSLSETFNIGGTNGNINGGAGGRLGADARAVGIAVRVPVRAIITPLILLSLRTLLLLYFFSPARKPIFGIMLGAWVLYEAWGAVRGAIGDNIPVNGNANGAAAHPLAPHQRADNANGANGRPDGGAFPPQNQGVARAPGLAASSADAVVSRLVHINLDDETRALDDDGNGARKPGLFMKVRVFVTLLLLTLHPAFWNRRRAALKMREGRLRTEANAREAVAQEAEGDESGDERAQQAREQLVRQHARRPAWVQEYVERVRRGDWVDD